jgi:hypothetical protein
LGFFQAFAGDRSLVRCSDDLDARDHDPVFGRLG